MTALRAWLSAGAACALAALTVNGIVHPLVALLSAALALGGIWAGDCVGALLAGTWARVGVGVAISVCLAGTSLWLDDGRLPALWSAILVALVAAGCLERPAWRSLASLPWVVGMLLLLPAFTARGPATAVLLAAGLVADLLALVAAQRLRAREAAPGAVRFPASAGSARAAAPPASSAGPRSVVGLARWYVAPVAFVLALAVVAVLLALGASRQQNLAGGAGAADGTGDTQRGVEDYTSGVLDLRARGKLPTTKVYSVSDPGPGLWRAAVLDAYDGTTWRDSQAYGTPRSLVAVDEDQAEVTRDGDPGAGTAQAPGAGSDYDVEVLVDDLMPVISPGVTTVVSAPAVANSPSRLFAMDAGGGPARSFFVMAAPRATTGVARYAGELRAAAAGPTGPTARSTGTTARWTGTTARWTGTTAGRAGTTADSTPETDARWTALPAALPQRVSDLAVQVAGDTPTRYDAVRAVETWLGANATYDLDSPVPPAGQDAVDHFLFDARDGFCEQFASSEVVMLRSLGIPARLASGWSAPGSRSAPQTLRGDQAHAWVEVWFPGVGWASSDPTARAAASQSRPSWVMIAVMLGAVALVGTAAALLGRWIRRRRRRRQVARPAPAPGASAQEQAGSDLVAAFHRMERALAAAGRPRTPNESPAGLSRRLELTLATLLGTRPDGVPLAEALEVAGPPAAGATQALAVYERLLYAADPPGAGELARAGAQLDAVTAALAAAAAGGRRVPVPVP